jgi:predicted N-acetyltransferase YhbS
MNVKIRQETEVDFPGVYKLLVNAFGQDDEARLVESLRNDPCFIPELSLVAFKGETLVGYILLSKISIIENDHQNISLALVPMAVDPAFQRMGVGGQLIREAHKLAKWNGYDSVIVLGHHEYYPRFGYKPADEWNIRCPYAVPRELFMGKELVMGSLRGISGLVKYANAFEKM